MELANFKILTLNQNNDPVAFIELFERYRVLVYKIFKSRILNIVRHYTLVCLVIVLYLFSACTVQKQPISTVLDSRVTMTVYSAEILESVISRLATNAGQSFEFNTLILSPYKAKAADYNNVTVKSILDEQLKDTPIVYEFRKSKLAIGLKTNEAAQR
jgi:hypothetical protein